MKRSQIKLYRLTFYTNLHLVIIPLTPKSKSMRKMLLFSSCALLFTLNAYSQIITPTPAGYFDLIIVFPTDAQPAAIGEVRRDLGAAELAITPITNARLWRMTTSRPRPASIPGSSIYFSYSDPIDAVEKVRGRTTGVGTGGALMQINVQTRLPEPYAPRNQKNLPSSLPPLVSCVSESGFLVQTIGASSVSIAILDTGLETDQGIVPIRFSNPVLAGYAAGGDARNFTTDYPEYNVNDKHGHGTSVASVIVHNFRRLGKLNCKIVPIKVLNNYGVGSLFALIQGLDHAIQKGVDIINISIVSPDKTSYRTRLPIELALQKAEEKGILVISAAGNDNKDINLPENRIYPACTDNQNQLVVSAGGCSGDRASFSNFGKTYVDLFAPGEKISVYGLNNVWKEVDGTSFAAPIVTGIAAGLCTHGSTRNWQKLVCALRSGSKPLAPFIDLCSTGGVINAGLAFYNFGTCK
jgi:subtilisin family serine protease